MATQLSTPVITAAVIDRTSIEVSGLAVDNASGYQVKIGTLSGGAAARAVAPVEGKAVFRWLYPRSVYYISARALGDDEDYLNSDWSAEISTVTGAVVDSEMEVPQIQVTTESFTTLKITGLTQYKEYRYQIANTAAGVEAAPVKNTGNYGGYVYIRGLEPGTEYFVRFCLVDTGRCSLWSDVVSGTTDAVTSTVEVTDGGDSGAGTLRQAVSDAADGTRIVLKCASVTLNSVISSTTKRVFIVGGLSDRTVIAAGNSNALFSIKFLAGRHLKFNGGVGGNIAITNGHFDDCALDAIISTNTGGFTSGAGFTDCRITNCQAGSYGVRYGVCYDCIITGCSSVASSNGHGGASGSSVLNNCLIANNTSVHNGAGAYDGTLTNCALVNNSAGGSGGGAASSTLVDCTITGNSAGSDGGGAKSGTLWNCLISGNVASGTVAGNGGGGIASAVAHCCIITDNHITMANEQGGGTWQSTINNCLVYNNTYSSNNYRSDVAQGFNVNSYIRNSTVDRIGVGTVERTFVYNTLYKTRSTTPTGADSNNLSYNGLDSSYFIDAAGGDYRLAVGSPAIGAGDNQFVTTETDLDGNPRIGGTNVDVGAYEFEPYQLEIPTFQITTGSAGECQVGFTLPSAAAAFRLQYANSADFTGAEEITSASAGIALSGLSGRVFFRGRSVGTEGLTLDSDWTEAQEAYFDTTAPVIVMPAEPMEMTFGQEIDFLAGVVIADDADPEPSVHYQVIDRDNLPVVVDGTDTDISSAGIPIGNYKLVITASDTSGNAAAADRGLAVLPARLATPSITIKSVSGNNVVIAGLLNLAAVGWKLEIDGVERSVTPDAAGLFAVTGLEADITHRIKAKALGDWVQPQPPTPPSGDARDSDWSNTVTVTIVSPQPREGAFWVWSADVRLSHAGRTLQNVELRARVADGDTGDPIPPTAVASAALTAYRVAADGTFKPITGFTNIPLPADAFFAGFDGDGWNFRFVPDQSTVRLLSAPGRFVLSVAVTPTEGNPFNIASEIITVY
ncbi:MAG: hypothetical protein IKE64_11210 [Thermoguttaceae bacterium]|nr:hypothetical protein [Thermoguttaceae bacterium]